ncbi:DUF4017 domain-containing protein [Bacillus clarus]|uniref:DUF4017 domain-containing protein n=1 Tax=Bacillus clarus TaxID=2338372 RepID=A0A090YZB7_9BACI|nr:DUF4017 family protein [Bacillus clarus]KFN03280.1 hypothetical protein DJ93_5222 [Bacillus clarus]RFT62907.1 DUF4017 domain-containing protein [Bacillus clarus]
MKNIIPPLLVYIIVCIIAVVIPASDGYNTIGWKLFVGQVYAIPILIVAAFLTFYINKKSHYK